MNFIFLNLKFTKASCNDNKENYETMKNIKLKKWI